MLREEEDCEKEVAEEGADEGDAGQEESEGKPQLVKGDDERLLELQLLQKPDVKHWQRVRGWGRCARGETHGRDARRAAGGLG